MSIRDRIESAFSDVPYPGDDGITDHKLCPECDDIADHFRGRTWHGHSIRDLQQYQSALPLFTPAALHYFLPAYMLASLGNWSMADMIPFSILCIWLPSRPDEDAGLRRHRSARFAVFTDAQREAIAAYLQEYAASAQSVLGDDDIPQAIDVLLNHGAQG